MRPTSRRKRHRIGHDRWPAAQRLQISQRCPPSRGLAPENRRGVPTQSVVGRKRNSVCDDDVSKHACHRAVAINTIERVVRSMQFIVPGPDPQTSARIDPSVVEPFVQTLLDLAETAKQASLRIASGQAQVLCQNVCEPSETSTPQRCRRVVLRSFYV